MEAVRQTAVSVGTTTVLTGMFSGHLKMWSQQFTGFLLMAGSWLMFLAMVASNWVPEMVVWGGLAAHFTWKWWKNRRPLRHNTNGRALGEKSLELVKKLVEKAQQWLPRPVPHPT